MLIHEWWVKGHGIGYIVHTNADEKQNNDGKINSKCHLENSVNWQCLQKMFGLVCPLAHSKKEQN